MDEQMEFEKLQELLAAYGDAESIQGPQEASTDSQLKSLALVTEEVLHKSPQGTVLDIGPDGEKLARKAAEKVVKIVGDKS